MFFRYDADSSIGLRAWPLTFTNLKGETRQL